jgi:hypothetical protein
VLSARTKREQVDNYTAELIYLLVSTQYNNVPKPAEYVTNIWKPKKPDKRTAKNIIDGLTAKLTKAKGGG